MAVNTYLGIEIGGTKLQLGVGTGDSTELIQLVRRSVEVSLGAEGIIETIEEQGRALCREHGVSKVGIGFGGPVNVATGVVTKSHQIDGWDNVPLAGRIQDAFGIPVCIDNDCNAAALAESRRGAGQGSSRVFYVTVGTGIGGGFVIDGRLDGNLRPAISEIGHLRPGPEAVSAESTVESVASGWGIANWTRMMLAQSTGPAATQLLECCGGDAQALTTKQIGDVAKRGNALAIDAIDRATKNLGWAIAQVVTLLAPEVIVVGGGVSLLGDTFFEPLRRHAATYAFGPLSGSYQIVPAQLGEEVVVHGAIQLAR